MTKSEPPLRNLNPLPFDAGPRPFWSVIIPTFQRSDLLKSCIEAIISQGVDRTQMEILISDNDPAGDLSASVAEWSQGRAIYTRNPRNIGTFPNINASITRSQGQWIHVVPDDDWVGPDFYAVMEKAIAAVPQKIGAAVSRHVNYREDNNTFEPAMPLAENAGTLGVPFLTRLAAINPIQIPAVAIRRQTFEKIGLFREDLPYTGDWEFWFRAANQVSWLYVPDTVAYFRMHSGSKTRALLRTAQTAEDLRRTLDLNQQILPPELARQIMPKARAHHASRLLANAKAALPLKLIDASERYVREAYTIHPDIINTPECQECLNHPALAHLRGELQ
jgi:protein O-GlcNAc transferase